jgi:DNA-binding XRE family transcriptional regulator
MIWYTERDEICSSSVESEQQGMVLMAEQVRGRPLPHLKAWRINKLMTQAQLIEKSGVARATVVRAERGSESVSFANIRKLAEALGITTDELLHADPEAKN